MARKTRATQGQRAGQKRRYPKRPLHVTVWEERDNLQITLWDATDTEVATWTDDDARQMFEDGFFDRRRLEQSVIEYAEYIGLLAQTMPVDNPPLEYREYGLFVWDGSGRYYWDERLDGKTYAKATAAEKAAEKRNALGEHGGMIVARPRLLIHERRTPGRNPVSATKARRILHEGRIRGRVLTPRQRGFFGARASGAPMPNPPRVVGLLGTPLTIRYRHARDRKLYEHKFGRTARVELLSDGSVRICSTQGKPMWGDF